MRWALSAIASSVSFVTIQRINFVKGIHKGRPNDEDMKAAADFAKRIITV